MKRNFLIYYLLAFTFLNTVANNENSSDGYKEILCELKPIVRNPSRIIKTRKTYPHLPFEINKGTSQNWAGYIAFGSVLKASVSFVTGTWNVPTVLPTNGNSYSSIWVGIDGYSSSTVEQLGTEHDWINGKQQNYAWFEMYPNYAYQITGFPVNIGDSITASVKYKGNNVFVLSIANNTKKVSTTIPTNKTVSNIAQRSSAEWVVEAPFSTAILPLSHFANVNFTKCTTIINGLSGSINKNSWKNNALNMVTSIGQPKAITSNLNSDGQNFNVSWKHQ